MDDLLAMMADQRSLVGEKDKLRKYCDLIIRWNQSINLIAQSTEEDIWDRHVIDSLHLLPHIIGNNKLIADFGCGAGFPGVVLAIMNPNNTYYLVESNKKKSAFLWQIKSALSLDNIIIMNNRIEKLADSYYKFDYIVSRGLASLEILLKYIENLLADAGVALFLKGKNYHLELSKVTKRQKQLFLLEIIEHDAGVVVKVMQNVQYDN